MEACKIPKVEHEKIIDMYQSGMTQNQIANIYHVSYGTISRIVRHINRDNGKYLINNISEDQVLMMYETYCNGHSMERVCEIYQISYGKLHSLFERYGLKTRSRSKSIRKYDICETYFDSIDTPNKAYILGFLYADGCHVTNKDTVTLALQEGDRKILEDIKQEIQTNKPLQYVQPKTSELCNSKGQYKLSITNKHMAQALEQAGLVPRKSLVLTFPTWLDKELYSHFIRGYLDGDGCIYLNTSTLRCRVSFISAYNFCNTVTEILMDVLGIKSHLRHTRNASDTCYTVEINKTTDIYKFLDWIYDGADLYLERKYQKYQQFLKMFNNINNS